MSNARFHPLLFLFQFSTMRDMTFCTVKKWWPQNSPRHAPTFLETRQWASRWNKWLAHEGKPLVQKKAHKKYQGVRKQSSLFHFLHGFLFASRSYNTSTIWIACKAGIFCSAINDFFGGNNAILPSRKLILPENWNKSKIDLKGAGYDIDSKSFVYINTYNKLLNRYMQSILEK